MCVRMLQIDYLHRTGRTARMGAKGKLCKSSCFPSCWQVVSLDVGMGASM